jgi:hypothetical protein
MAVKELKESQTKMRLTLNLDEMFGVDLTGYQELKQRIAQRVVEIILDRTEKGVDVNGSRFAPYSKEYKKSLAFKAFKKGNKVNLELTGQMLGTMEVLDTTGSQIEIGWEDPVENAKAFNHNTGDTLPKRRFFDLSEKEIKSIKEEFQPDVETEFSPTVQSIKILQSLAQPKLPSFDFGEDNGF